MVEGKDCDDKEIGIHPQAGADEDEITCSRAGLEGAGYSTSKTGGAGQPIFPDALRRAC